MSANDFLTFVANSFAVFLSEVESKVNHDNSLPDASIYISRILSNNLIDLSGLLTGIDSVDLYV